MNSVISCTGMPLAWATSEWATSCASTDRKNSALVATAVIHVVTRGQSGKDVGNVFRARLQVRSSAMITQLAST